MNEQWAWEIYQHRLSQGPMGDANLDGVVTFSDAWDWLGLLFQFPGAAFLAGVLKKPEWAQYWEMGGSVTGGWAIFWSCVGWLLIYGMIVSAWTDWQAKREEKRHDGL